MPAASAEKRARQRVNKLKSLASSAQTPEIVPPALQNFTPPFDFSFFIENADIIAIHDFLSTVTPTTDGRNLKLLWKCAYEEGRNHGVDEGMLKGSEDYARGLKVDSEMATTYFDVGREQGTEEGEEHGRETERQAWLSSGHGIGQCAPVSEPRSLTSTALQTDDPVTTPTSSSAGNSTQSCITVSTQTESTATISSQTQTTSPLTTLFTTIGVQTNYKKTEETSYTPTNSVSNHPVLTNLENSSPDTVSDAVAPTTVVSALETCQTAASLTQNRPKTQQSPVFNRFNWGDDANTLPILSTPQSSQHPPRDFSCLRSASTHPFSSLRRRRGHPKNRRNTQRSGCHGFSHPFSAWNHSPTSLHTPFRASTLDWNQDPRLADLSTALRALGWIRA